MERGDAQAQCLVARLAAMAGALAQRYADWEDLVTVVDLTAPLDRIATVARHQAQRLDRLLTPTTLLPATTLARPPRHWLEGLALLTLVDRALTVVLASGLDSSWPEFAATARDVLREKHPITVEGDSWVRHLGSEGGPVARALEDALRTLWQDTLCWFGPPDDPGIALLVRLGMLDAMPDVLRARLLTMIGPLGQAAGLRLPVRPARRGNAWELIEPLPWDRWDADAWRLRSRSEVEYDG